MSNRDVPPARRVALVTGASGVIGKAIARALAASGAFEVVLACRSRTKAERAVRDVSRDAGRDADHVRYELVDVARQASVAELVARWRGPLHVLVNNAATAPRGRETTPEGLERVFATNVLGYFWMTRLFADLLSASAPARVVNVASYWAGGLDLDDMQFERRRYDNDAAYRQSKQAERMLTVAFAERLRERGVMVNACHPGDVDSALSHSLGFGGHDTPAQSAETPVWLATSPEAAALTGRYFEHLRERSCRFGAERDAVEALFRACETLTG
jgi:NAD(P)-dependent dehydrogenase (short-subunit alcohol dehydrogenase family)